MLDLWTFQDEDVTRFEDQQAVLFAWEMGCGKTPAAVERDWRLRLRMKEGKAPTLVVAPIGTHDGWEAWFAKTPLKVVRINPKDRFRFMRTPGHVYIVHPEALIRMPEVWQYPWFHVILDECQMIKNHKTKTFKTMRKIRKPFKTALSGTPVTTRPQDFWGTLNWLKPSVWTSVNRFIDTYVDYWKMPNEDSPLGYTKVPLGPKNVDQLLSQIAPYFSRHLKTEQCCPHHPEGVMPWLPKKYFRDPPEWVDLGPLQRRAYDQMNEEMIAWVGEHEDEPVVAPVVIAQLNRLMQFALGYIERVDGKLVMSEPSAKLDRLVNMVQTQLGPKQLIVASQWKSPLTPMTAKRLEKEGISYVTYTGDDSHQARRENKAKFMAGDAQLLLMSVKAGGVGVDGLQKSCSTMVFLDRDWSPAFNRQCEDRLHRGGQESPVEVIDIMARDTVDLGRHQRIETKWYWIKKLLGDHQRAL